MPYCSLLNFLKVKCIFFSLNYCPSIFNFRFRGFEQLLRLTSDFKVLFWGVLFTHAQKQKRGEMEKKNKIPLEIYNFRFVFILHSDEWFSIIFCIALFIV